MTGINAAVSYALVEPKNVEIEKAVNVKAKVNENDKTEVNIESMNKDTG